MILSFYEKNLWKKNLITLIVVLKKKKSVIFIVDLTTNHFALSFIVEN